MSMDVADVRQGAGSGGDVSGSVIHVLIAMVRAHSGEAGVAQALALAGEQRTFAELDDPDRWSSLNQTVALLNAAALVTGDGAVGLHVGEVLLFTPAARTFTDRLRALGSESEVLKHIEPVIEHFDTTATATTLEVAADHALVEVVPRQDRGRHAHLCEMTRGLLSQVPSLFDGEPALDHRDGVQRPGRPPMPLRHQLGGRGGLGGEEAGTARRPAPPTPRRPSGPAPSRR